MIVGAGVALFTLFCPRQITGYRGYEDFITFKESTKTTIGIVGSLRLTIGDFLQDARDNDDMPDETGGSLKYPRRFREGLISLVRAGARGTETGDASASAGNIARDGDVEVLDVLKRLSDDSVEDNDFRGGFFDGLAPLSIDVFRLEYLKADYSKPSARTLAFWLIAIGTLVVLIPTLITTILVLSDLFSVSTEPVLPDGTGG